MASEDVLLGIKPATPQTLFMIYFLLIGTFKTSLFHFIPGQKDSLVEVYYIEISIFVVFKEK